MAGAYFQRFFEKYIWGSRSIENPKVPLSKLTADDFFGESLKTTSGKRITEESALTFSAVYRCVTVIAQTIASLPYQVFERLEDSKKPVPEHPVYRLLHAEPNQFMTAFTFKMTLVANALLWGNGYAIIILNNFAQPVAFDLVHPAKVTIKKIDGELWYEVFDDDGNKELVSSKNMIHITCLGSDGISGKSIVRLARETIGLGLAAEESGASTYGNGFKFAGVFQAEGVLDDAAAKRFNESLKKYQGAKNSNKAPILPYGMKFQPTSMPLQDAEFLGTRKFQITDVCRWFGVQPHKAFDLEKATFSNIEHQNIDFATDTILPWCERIEQEFDRKIFSEADKAKGRYFTEHNMNGILRADIKSRSEFYKNMLDRGVFNINTVLRLENMNTIPEGERRFIPLNFQPLDMVDKNQEAARALLIKELQNHKANED